MTVLVSAAPVFGHPLIEAKIQLKQHQGHRVDHEQGPAAVDREAWSLNPAAFEALLATLVPFRRVVILSGDVHYGFAGSVAYWDRRDGHRQARFVQCTVDAAQNEDRRHPPARAGCRPWPRSRTCSASGSSACWAG